MRIGLDNRSPKFSGMGIYTHNLYENFTELNHKVSLY